MLLLIFSIHSDIERETPLHERYRRDASNQKTNTNCQCELRNQFGSLGHTNAQTVNPTKGTRYRMQFVAFDSMRAADGGIGNLCRRQTPCEIY